MPDSSGAFKGISVPRIPWLERYPDDCIHEDVNASKTCEICSPWLDQNEEAKAMVERGLEQAGRGELTDGPMNLEKADAILKNVYRGAIGGNKRR